MEELTYLVTGGCGFIGSTLTKKLAEEGNNVIVVDDMSTGNAKNLKLHRKIKVRIEPVSKLFIKHFPEYNDIDFIYHLGIPSSSPIYRKDRTVVATAIADFIQMLEFARVRKIPMVFASSSSVYNGQIPPFNEMMSITPTDFYTEARYAMERIANVYEQFYGTRVIGLRLFSVYGDNEFSKGKYANLISQMKWEKKKKAEFEIYGDGTTVRDFVHVNDVVRAFERARAYAGANRIFNVGTGKGYTINEIASAIGVKTKYVENPLINYVTKTVADTTLAEKELMFKSSIDVMDYIKS